MTIDRATIQQNLNDLANRFDGKAPVVAAQLRDLGEAVNGGQSAVDWAFSDIFRILNPERLAAHLQTSPSQKSWLRWAELARNVIVLLPLAFTWFGISQAVKGYYGLLDAKPLLAAQSFIYLWQSGFEGRTSLTLSIVAAVDAALLALVIILTFLVYWKQASQKTPSGKDRISLEQDIEEVLAQANFVLSAYRQPQGLAGLAEMQRVAEQLVNGLKTEASQLAQGLTQGASQMTQDLQQEAGQVVRVLQEEYERLQKLSEQRERELGSLTPFTDRLDTAAQNILLSAQSLHQAHVTTLKTIGALVVPTEALATQTKDLGPITREVSMKLEMLVGEQKQTSASIGLVVSQQKVLVGQLAASINTLVGAADTSAQAASALSALGQHLANEQSNLIDALAGERQAQQNLANVVSQSNYHLDLALQQISSNAVRLHGIGVDLTAIAQTLPPILDAMKNSFGQMAQDHVDTTAHIASSSHKIEQAADAIEQIAHNILPTMTSLAQYAQMLEQISRRTQSQTSGRNPNQGQRP